MTEALLKFQRSFSLNKTYECRKEVLEGARGVEVGVGMSVKGKGRGDRGERGKETGSQSTENG